MMQARWGRVEATRSRRRRTREDAVDVMPFKMRSWLLAVCVVDPDKNFASRDHIGPIVRSLRDAGYKCNLVK